MKTLYIECNMGAAGDMLTAALLELLEDKEAFIKELNSIGIPGVVYKYEPDTKCGITGTHVTVTVNGTEEDEHIHEHHHSHEHEHAHAHEHHHSGLHDIEHIVRGHLNIPDKVRDDVMEVYNLIAEAESHVHGVPITDIHFHEVGTMDAIADICAVCLLINRIAPDDIVASPVHVGSGQVKCAHGILPVPAPATAYILKDVPTYGGSINGELCTPTGAALLKYYVRRFGDMPVMKTGAVGYGMGKKDFEAANCVRVFLGETPDKEDSILEFEFNVDDMTAESVSCAMKKLFDEGALEVYTTPVGMKKSRPGILFTVLCRQEDRVRMTELIFRHTSTIGIRETLKKRVILERSIESVSTKYGEIRKKTSRGYGVTREKFEYEDIAKTAEKNGLSLDEVIKEIEK